MDALLFKKEIVPEILTGLDFLEEVVVGRKAVYKASSRSG